jgi:actin-related protein 5
MTELWFEAYRVPSLCFGVDALYSLYHHHHHHTLSMNRQGELILGGGGGGGGESQYQQHLLPHNILVVSAAHSATHLLPIVNGEWLPHLSLRLDVAGAHCTEYFQRLLHLKYPLHRTSLSRDIVQHLKHLLCYTAPHYIEELTRYAVYFSNPPVATEQIPTSGPILLQLPLNSSSLSSSSSPSLSSSAKVPLLCE